MPLKLDKIDNDILESLLEDGRKSFRQVSREIKVSTPTVKARYQRLVNVGLIKAVLPVIDFGKIESKESSRLDKIRSDSIKNHNIKIGKNIVIRLSCDYCKGRVHGKPSILKFANFERFFCCPSCKTLYQEKHRGRIQSLSNKIKFD
jgi:DNA-binding Lrp family transcriptional regulator